MCLRWSKYWKGLIWDDLGVPLFRKPLHIYRDEEIHNSAQCIHYPGKRPQTVWRCGGIMYDNVDDVEDNEVQDDDVEDDEVEDDDVEVDDENEDGNEEDEVEDVKVEDDVELLRRRKMMMLRRMMKRLIMLRKMRWRMMTLRKMRRRLMMLRMMRSRGRKYWCWEWWCWGWRRWCWGGWCWGAGPIPRRGPTLCASLRRRNARQHCSRAILCGSLQEMPAPKSATNTLCELAQSKCTEGVSQKPFCARIYK